MCVRKFKIYKTKIEKKKNQKINIKKSRKSCEGERSP